MTWLVVRFPNLPIALARRDDPALATRPLVLVTLQAGQARVVAASDPALPAGLPLRKARLRCPDAQFQVCEPAPLELATGAIQAVLAAHSPRVSALAGPPDVAAATELGRLPLPQAQRLATAIGAQLAQAIGIQPALGLGAHATIAQLAAQVAEPGAQIVVPLGGEAAWLAPRPIPLLASAHSASDRLPLDPALVVRLRQFGLRTIGALASLPRDALEAQFGPAGRRLHTLATGRALDIPPPEAAPVTIRIGWRFAGAVADQQTIDTALDRIIGRLAQRLVHGGQAVRRLTLSLDLADAPPQDSARVLAEPTADPALLRAVVQALLRAAPLACGIERLSVAAELVALQAVQQELFPTPPARAEQLQALLSRLAPRHTAHLCRATITSPHAACLEQRVQLNPWETP